MTQDQIIYLSQPSIRQHFELVLKHKQRFQRSHDITKPIIELCADVLGRPIDLCTECVADAMAEIETIYQKQINERQGNKKN